MRNRAKCKLCGDIIESFHRHDLIECSCGEISIEGGLDYFKASARDFKNFLRIDDEGKEIEVKLVEEMEEKENLFSKEEVWKQLEEYVKALGSESPERLHLPLTSYDLYNFAALVTNYLHFLREDLRAFSSDEQTALEPEDQT